MFEAINEMLLDLLAAVARKDYDDRRRRQAQGQAKAKAEGRYKGRPEDTDRNEGIARMLVAGQLCSRGCAVRVTDEDSNELYRSPIDLIPPWLKPSPRA